MPVVASWRGSSSPARERWELHKRNAVIVDDVLPSVVCPGSEASVLHVEASCFTLGVVQIVTDLRIIHFGQDTVGSVVGKVTLDLGNLDALGWCRIGLENSPRGYWPAPGEVVRVTSLEGNVEWFVVKKPVLAVLLDMLFDRLGEILDCRYVEDGDVKAVSRTLGSVILDVPVVARLREMAPRIVVPQVG